MVARAMEARAELATGKEEGCFHFTTFVEKRVNEKIAEVRSRS